MYPNFWYCRDLGAIEVLEGRLGVLRLAIWSLEEGPGSGYMRGWVSCWEEIWCLVKEELTYPDLLSRGCQAQDRRCGEDDGGAHVRGQQSYIIILQRERENGSRLVPPDESFWRGFWNGRHIPV